MCCEVIHLGNADYIFLGGVELVRSLCTQAFLSFYLGKRGRIWTGESVEIGLCSELRTNTSLCILQRRHSQAVALRTFGLQGL